MRIVIALGGNALLQRGQPMTAENQRANIRLAAECIAAVDPGNEIVVAHGNGPQVGLLALQAAAYHDVAPYPLDVLGAQTEAMIGYVIEQELGNLLPAEQPIATLLTMIEVDRDGPRVRPSHQADRTGLRQGYCGAPQGRERLGHRGRRRHVPPSRRQPKAQADLRDPSDPQPGGAGHDRDLRGRWRHSHHV